MADSTDVPRGTSKNLSHRTLNSVLLGSSKESAELINFSGDIERILDIFYP